MQSINNKKFSKYANIYYYERIIKTRILDFKKDLHSFQTLQVFEPLVSNTISFL